MGDSDDEYDRRRGRDKFRRERNDYNERPAVPRRDEWPERSEPSGGWGGGQRDRIPRRDYRDGGGYNSMPSINSRLGHGGRMDHYGGDRREMSPPNKRMRGGFGNRDLDDRYDFGGGHHGRGGHYGSGGDHRGGHGFGGHDREDETFQAPMMTLKQFLNEQDDMIDEETLIKKYNDYKINFRRMQVQEFFNRHKDEEWFRSKYFPDEVEKRKVRQKEAYRNRLAVFMDLYEKDWITNVSLDVDNNDQLTRLLDAAIIKLEGGTDFDLKSLDEVPEETDKSGKDVSLFAVEDRSTVKASLETEGNTKAADGGEEAPKGDEEGEIDGEAGEVRSQTGEPATAEGADMEEGETNHSLGDGASNGGNAENKVEEENKPRPWHKTCSIFLRNILPGISRQEVEEECKKFPGFMRLALSEAQVERRFARRGWATYERNVKIRDICWSMSSTKIKGTDIGAIVNRDLARRVRSVIGLTSHKAIVRADIRHAAKLVMKLDAEKGLWLDDEEQPQPEQPAGADEEAKKNGTTDIKAPSKNPLLKNITDYLIEEASAEEAALLGEDVDEALNTSEATGATGGDLNHLGEGADTSKNGGLDGDDKEGGAAKASTSDVAALERDDELIKVLDRLILYLRIVHSFDYYTLSEYPLEDEMPNRIGLLHARGLFSSTRVSPNEIADYIKDFETKVTPLLETTTVLSTEEATKLGLKNFDEAVEAFINENTKELGEGKWLCPLSNKKFMGAEYVRKHILNKHAERIEQVKSETQYFNNYVLDPKRPSLLENRPQGGHQPMPPPPPHHHHHHQQMPLLSSSPYPMGRDMRDYPRYGGRAPPGYGGGGRFSLPIYQGPPPPMMEHDMRGGGFKRNRSEMSRDAVDYDDVNMEEFI